MAQYNAILYKFQLSYYIVLYYAISYSTQFYHILREHTMLYKSILYYVYYPPFGECFCRGPDGPDGVDCRAPGSWLAVGLVLAMLTSITIVTTRRLTLAILVTAAVLLNFTTPPSSSFMPPH